MSLCAEVSETTMMSEPTPALKLAADVPRQLGPGLIQKGLYIWEPFHNTRDIGEETTIVSTLFRLPSLHFGVGQRFSRPTRVRSGLTVLGHITIRHICLLCTLLWHLKVWTGCRTTLFVRIRQHVILRKVSDQMPITVAHKQLAMPETWAIGGKKG